MIGPDHLGLVLLKSMGQIFPKDLIFSRTFSPGIKSNNTYKRISDNFLGMLTYELFLENCQKSICMHSCSSVRKSLLEFMKYLWKMLEFHVFRIGECNTYGIYLLITASRTPQTMKTYTNNLVLETIYDGFCSC